MTPPVTEFHLTVWNANGTQGANVPFTLGTLADALEVVRLGQVEMWSIEEVAAGRKNGNQVAVSPALTALQVKQETERVARERSAHARIAELNALPSATVIRVYGGVPLTIERGKAGFQPGFNGLIDMVVRVKLGGVDINFVHFLTVDYKFQRQRFIRQFEPTFSLDILEAVARDHLAINREVKALRERTRI